jgi:hypothetical protein
MYLRILGNFYEYGYHYGSGSGGGNFYVITAPQPIDTGWHHLALCYSSVKDTIYFYRDGVQANRTYVPQPHSLNYNNVYFGAQYNNGSMLYTDTRFHGTMDEFFYYNRKLTITEVISVMNNYKSPVVSGLSVINHNLQMARIFPNPANNELNIEFSSGVYTNGCRYEMINSTGQLIYSGIITSSIIKVDLSESTSTGLNHVRIIDEKGNIVLVKSIILSGHNE